MVKLIAVAISVFSSVALSDPCADIANLSCSKKTLDDGTGKVSRHNEKFAEEAQKEFAELLKFYEKNVSSLSDGDIEKIFQASKTTANVDIGIKRQIQKHMQPVDFGATGLASNPSCKNKAGRKKTACLKVIARYLATATTVELTHIGRLLRSSSSLDVDLPIVERGMKEAKARIRKRLSRSKDSKDLKSGFIDEVKSNLRAIVGANVSDNALATKLANKIGGITFSGVDCTGDNPYRGTLTNAHMKNAFYDSTKNSFQVCQGFLNSGKSEFMLAYVIAHELAHSIDPCIIQKKWMKLNFQYKSDSQKGAEKEYPIQVIQCLRSQKSVGAKSVQRGLKLRDGKLVDPEKSPVFCDVDQIGESMCDWLAAEVLGRLLKTRWKHLSKEQVKNGMANTVRNFCAPVTGLRGVSSRFSVHPHSNRRLNQILLAHPEIRNRIGCGHLDPQKTKYCKPGAKGGDEVGAGQGQVESEKRHHSQ